MPALTPELFKKFWSGLCTEEEAMLVEAYFREHPEDDSLLEEFEAASGEPIAGEDREEMLAAVTKVTRPRRGLVARGMGGGSGASGVRSGLAARRIGWMMAAASLVGVWVAAWLMYRQDKNMAERPVSPVAAVWVGKHNADRRNVRVALPDSTETILAPGATILYRQDLGHYDKREVKVEGQAVFSVRRNKEQPFIVYSDGVQTTVLGTIFEVSNDRNSDIISVRLLQGKVMVGTDAKSGDSSKHYYLKPGEELVYGRLDKSVAVHEFNSGGSGTYTAHRVKRIPSRPDSLANWYMFNNQGLADVFDQLAIIYNVEIQYSAADLRNKYFIGKLDRKDSLHKIIRDIALLNHLFVVEREGCFVVRRLK